MGSIKIISLVIFIWNLTLQCQSQIQKEPDSPASSNNTTAKPDAVKRIMDSLLKIAGPNARISIEGSPETKIDSSETKGLAGSELKTLNSKALDSLIKSSDKKYTFLHFWATWCTPCRKEFPELVKEVSALINTDVILISCDYDSEEQRKKVLAVYKKLNTQLPVFINQINDPSDGMGIKSQQELLKNFGSNSKGGLPYNILIENSSRKIITEAVDYKEVISRSR